MCVSFSLSLSLLLSSIRFYLPLHGSTRPNKKDHLLRSRDFVASTTVASRTLGSLHASTPSTISSVSISLPWTAIPSIPRRPPTPKRPTVTDFPRGALFRALESWARLLRRKLLTIDSRVKTRNVNVRCVIWIIAKARAGVCTDSRHLLCKLKPVQLSLRC